MGIGGTAIGTRLSPCLSDPFSTPEKVDFEYVLSLFKIFFLCQFCSPLVGFFWLVPGFVEGDYIVKRLQHGFVNSSVTTVVAAKQAMIAFDNCKHT